MAVSSIQLRRLRSTAIVDGMSRDESLGLRRNRCEDTFLREARAIGAPAILVGVEARAANLSGNVISISE